MAFDYRARIATRINEPPLGKLLNSLRMDSVFLTDSTLGAPWSITLPAMNRCMMFHLVLENSGQLTVGDKTTQLHPGDFVLLPHGEGHIISDGTSLTSTGLEDLPIECITDRFETLSFGGKGVTTRMLCGALTFEHPLALRLLNVLPPVILIPGDSRETQPVVSNLGDLLLNETQSMAVGSEAVITRLADILVVTAMRSYLEDMDAAQTSWINALEDDRIGASMRLIHDEPDKHWSLEELASQVGMSRTSFATQFKRLVGNTPMDYLTEWRMSLAFSKLQHGQDSILSIALDIGYQSEAAFSRAFKKVVGQTPGEVRKAGQTS